jgi:hypothetical protein
VKVVAVYKLLNPENTYIRNAKITHYSYQGVDRYSVSDVQGTFHFITNTLKYAKDLVAINYKLKGRLKWTKEK